MVKVLLKSLDLDKIEVNDSYPIKTGLRRYYDFIGQSSTERNQKNYNEWILEGESLTVRLEFYIDQYNYFHMRI